MRWRELDKWGKAERCVVIGAIATLTGCGFTGFTSGWLLLPAWIVLVFAAWVGVQRALGDIPEQNFVEHPYAVAATLSLMPALLMLCNGSTFPMCAFRWMGALNTKTWLVMMHAPSTWVCVAFFFGVASLSASFAAGNARAYIAKCEEELRKRALPLPWRSR